MNTFLGKTIGTILFLLLNLVCVAKESDVPQPKDVASPLRIVYVKDNAPFSILLPDGSATGLYIEFWQLWSETNSIPVTFIPASISQSIVTLKKRQADFHVGLFKNEERSQWGDFSLPIHQVDTGIYFRNNPGNLDKLADLKGKKVAVQIGTYQQKYLQNKYPQISWILFDDADSVLNDLLNQKITAIVSEVPYLDSQIAKMGLRGVFSLGSEKVLTNQVYALIPKEGNDILKLVNSGIEQIPVDKIVALEKKWLPNIQPFFSNRDAVKTLNSKEKLWLSTHSTFRLGIDQTWSPFEFVDAKGAYTGMSSEYVALIKRKLNIELMPALDLNWNQALDELKNGKIDVMSGIVRTEDRAKYINFTEPYISLASVITTRKDAFFVQGMDELDGKNIAVIGGYVFEDFIRKNHPNIKVTTVKSIAEGLAKLEQGEVDGFIDALATINHELNKEKYNDIIVAAFTPYNLELSMGVRQGLEPLIPILNKALSSITTKEKSKIANHWLSIRVNVGADYQTLLYWLVPTLLVLIFIILFVVRANRRMQFEILERHKVEKTLEEARDAAETANRAKGEFLANMSHEIRTPMNAVVGMAHLLEESGLTEKQSDLNQTLQTSAASLLILIDDILDLSKVEAGRLELELVPFCLKEVVGNVEQQVRFIIDNKSIELNIHIDPKLPKILIGDPLRIGQILLNLANNAVKFTKRGEISISVDRVKALEDKIEMLIGVKDTGIGMDEEQQKRLFKTYSQADSSTSRKYGGSGLGLTICKKLTELMGGKIWMESTPNQGSQFFFTLKLKYQSNESEFESLKVNEEVKIIQSSDPKTSAKAFLNGKNILLVDDNEVNLMVAKTILTNAGMNVLTALNGEQALNLVKARSFDAILMDIQMPVMDGYEATQYIRKKLRKAKLPIIAVSANAMRKDVEKSLAAGMNAHISKPLNVERLLDTLTNQISAATTT